MTSPSSCLEEGEIRNDSETITDNPLFNGETNHVDYQDGGQSQDDQGESNPPLPADEIGACAAAAPGSPFKKQKLDRHESEDGLNRLAETNYTTKLYLTVEDHRWPIVYHPDYNIGFLGLEKLHPFDSRKWEKVFTSLKEFGLVRDDTIVYPEEASEKDLLEVHTKRYINSLKQQNFQDWIPEWSVNVASITEVPPVALLPNFIVQRKVLYPLRLQTGGSVLAAKLAVQRGWSINIGGGFHHCSSGRGGGFCAYADITLCIKFLFEHMPNVIDKAMIVDLDAHQGNGHERDFMDDDRVYVMDVYNRNIYPHDGFAKRKINKKVELPFMIGDKDYLPIVERCLNEALSEFDPSIIVYNAGTDILQGDRLGAMDISPQGVVDRDALVFKAARERCIPIVMLTSGGYQRVTAQVIADSIMNLYRNNLIKCDTAEEYQANIPEKIWNRARMKMKKSMSVK